MHSNSITVSFIFFLAALYEYAEVMDCGSDTESPFTTYYESAVCEESSEEDPVYAYPFEEYDDGKLQYTRDLVFRHLDHIEQYNIGLMKTQNFILESVNDIYIMNLYTMSWFYNDVYPFDSYEADRDSYLYDSVLLRMTYSDTG